MTLVSVPVNEVAVAHVFGGVLNDGKGGKQVGDITSDTRGSGARYNKGKAPLDLLLLSDAERMLPGGTDAQGDAKDALAALGVFQASRDADALLAVIDALYPIRTEALEAASHVLAYGAMKYKAWNWAKGMDWSVPLACAARHLFAIYNGKQFDVESGEEHRAHVVCNVLMLAAFARFYPEGDDLPRVGGSSSAPAAFVHAEPAKREEIGQAVAQAADAARPLTATSRIDELVIDEQWRARCEADFRHRVGLDR